MEDEQDSAEIRVRLARVQLEHDDYHTAIAAMIAQGCDPLKVQRMKKKKLRLKDEINKLASNVIPDITA